MSESQTDSTERLVENMVCPRCAKLHGHEHEPWCLYGVENPSSEDLPRERLGMAESQRDAAVAEVHKLREQYGQLDEVAHQCAVELGSERGRHAATLGKLQRVLAEAEEFAEDVRQFAHLAPDDPVPAFGALTLRADGFDSVLADLRPEGVATTKVPSEDCKAKPTSSAMCSRGTKGCEETHAP